MRRVLVTGGSGLVGSKLIEALLNKGVEVHNLSRSGKAPKNAIGFKWDYSQDYLEKGTLEGVDSIFHLAGAGVADQRWSDKRKKEILDSRIKTANLLFNAVKKMEEKPKAFLSASGIAFYGTKTTDKTFTENDSKGSGFLADVSEQWEQAAQQFTHLDLNAVCLRIGVVLAKNGGALQKMAQPIKWGLGSPLGSGKQIMPWIHIEDLVNLFIYAAENQWSGVYNAVSGSNPSNIEMTKAIAEVLNRPVFLPHVPAFVLRLILGEMADEIALEGSAVSNQKITEIGFETAFSDLPTALRDCLN